MMRLLLIFLFLASLFSACTDQRKEKSLLLINPSEELAGWMDSDRWSTRIMDASIHGLSEDSLALYSAVVIPLSELDDLYYRDRNALERYLESGGGILAIKDTIKTFPVWPITDALQKMNVGDQNSYKKGRIALLAPGQYEKISLAVEYVIGKNEFPDYKQATTLGIPDSSRFSRQVLVQGMDEPMQMQVLPNMDVLIVERKGAVKLYDSDKNTIRIIARFDVFSGIEDGLLGVSLDPDYQTNHWVYFYYAVGGDEPKNRLSRMVLDERGLDQSTEKILLEIPTQRQYCCHSAGYLKFDANGLLYLSVGDNTNAEETEGYTPLDERPGRELADDQATAANTNDLRGKILRIRPEKDGSYSIPEGNLFPVGTPKTRPEIYVMGCRNPYRFSVDSRTGTLYWGDIGPDTKVTGPDGLLSFDEFNKANEPGFYGWPYFLGNNQPFPYYDFETKKPGPKFDPANPVNASPNNTGMKNLPLPQPAFIWYGPQVSRQFPLVGQGGASAMAGPVYNKKDWQGKPYALPEYYDGKLIIFEWIRNWIMVVEFDEDGDMVSMEPFLDQYSFDSPVDFAFGPDGAIYVLEYGTNWFSKNTNAKLVRIEYVEGNRKPVARIRTDQEVGAVPLTIQLDASESFDYDGDGDLEYTWNINNEERRGERASYTFTEPGVYSVQLKVTDSKGAAGISTVKVEAGNSPPVIHLIIDGNRTFYSENETLNYHFTGSDAEDGPIGEEEMNIRFGYLNHRDDLALVLGDTEGAGFEKFSAGRTLIDGNDCQSCHALKDESVGPSYKKIAERYQRTDNVVEQLSDKISQGGSGNWGSRPMTPHPSLNREDIRMMVEYILSLNESRGKMSSNGTVTFDRQNPGDDMGGYVLMAEYTDKGGPGSIAPITTRVFNLWQSRKVEAELFDEGNVNIATITTLNLSYIRNVKNRSFIHFEDIDLTGISSLRYRIRSNGAGGQIRMHLDGIEGPCISEIAINAGQDDKWEELSASVKDTKGVHDLYFVFTNKEANQSELFQVDWISFE